MPYLVDVPGRLACLVLKGNRREVDGKRGSGRMEEVVVEGGKGNCDQYVNKYIF